LAKACRAAGPDGSFAIDVAGIQEPIVIDSPLLDRLAQAMSVNDPVVIASIAGRLHLVDVEPDRVGIRTAAGVEWACRYPEELEGRIKSLIDHVVWVKGHGAITSPLRGTMTIERIEAVESEQSALFTMIPVDEDELLARQGIVGPQGLAALADPEWEDDTDDAYLAALLSK
jgi:hypothetical protein